MVFRHAEIGGSVFPPCGAAERGFGDDGNWLGFGRGWMLHVQCGFGIVLTESERGDFFAFLGCSAAIDGSFCCGPASFGGGLGAGEAPPSMVFSRLGYASRLRFAPWHSSAPIKLRNKKIVEAAIFCGRLGHALAIGADGFGWGRRSDICNKILGGSIGVICRRNQWHN